jgi:hypothetical protein
MRQPRDRVIKICEALPEVIVEEHGLHVGFKIRSKTFAWFLDDHHGDGKIALSCKVPPGEQEDLIASDPERFYEPAYTGPKGWIAIRLDVGEVDWKEVTELAADTYRLIAPKRLAELAMSRFAEGSG